VHSPLFSPMPAADEVDGFQLGGSSSSYYYWCVLGGGGGSRRPLEGTDAYIPPAWWVALFVCVCGRVVCASCLTNCLTLSVF
jgi:hypothetical protein